jgi:hypothetical protein
MRRGVVCTWCVVTPPGEEPLFRGEIRDVVWNAYWQRMLERGRVQCIAPETEARLLDCQVAPRRGK